MSQYVYDRWGADRGFIGGTIYAISESADGYLWIATERGLVRFDGTSFTLIQHPLPNAGSIGPVRGLVTDVEGNLWIRLEGPGMLRYRDGRFEDAYPRLNLQDIPVAAAALDNAGNVVFAGLLDRTIRFRNGNAETVVNADKDLGVVRSVAVARDGRIWSATEDGILFRADAGRPSKIVEEPANTRINTLLPAINGGLWIGTNRGLQLWDGSKLANLDLPPSIENLPILALAMDHDANVWAGTSAGALRITKEHVASLDRIDLRAGDEVTAIFEDRDGDMWFGGSNGVERLRDGMFATYSVSEGLPSDKNGPIYVDADGRIWFAPLAGGLYCMKDDKIRRVALDGPAEDVVYSISGGRGEIWVGRQNGGLTRITMIGDSFSTRTFTQADGLAQNSVFAVLRARDGTVWAGTVSGGLSKLQGGKFTSYSEPLELPSNTVNSIAEGANGKIWLGTPIGLISFSNGHWTNHSEHDGLPSPNVITVFDDSDHVVWIGTAGGLAYMLSGRIAVPRRLPGVLREQILGIAEDGMGSLWFTTPDHLLRVNRDHLLRGDVADTDVESFGIGDGLKGVEGIGRDRTLVADHNGHIWASLNRGLSVADPAGNASRSVPVSVRIESMSAGGNPVSLSSLPKLGAGVQSVVLHYAGTNLSAPERVRFRYKLDGSDKGWSDVTASNQVDYTNLGPGTYRFHVIASNTDGLWNGDETSFPFVIEPAVWQTWWFRTICFLLCLLAIFGYYRLRVYQLTKRLNLRFQDRLAERTRIAQELHDTLLQGVLSATLQLDLAEDQLPDDSPAKPLVKRVLQLMGKVTEEGRNTLRGLRAPEPGGDTLEMAFVRMKQEFAIDERTGYRVTVNSTTRPLRPIIRDEVYRIGREALVNAIAHAHARNIDVEVEYASDELKVLVRDDGLGIDPRVLRSGREGHWGLPGMRERSEGIGASLRVRSRVGAGTEVELTVPSKVAFEGKLQNPIWRRFKSLRNGKPKTPRNGNNKRSNP
jgi:ligand-binding sensor domain-containing protein/signal transduction histidine kinase